MKKLLSLVMVLCLASLVFVGCGKKEASEIENFAIQYVSDVTLGNWEEVMSASTGDQLAIYTQLAPMLENLKQDSNIQKVEVIDQSINKKHTLAFITVYRLANINIDGYGSVLDEKQVLLSLKNIDGVWKVFRYDIVSDINKKID